MKSLLATFMALSLMLGPLQEINAAAASNTPSAAAPAITRGADLERVFLVGLLNRTRLYKTVNWAHFSVLNHCLIEPHELVVVPTPYMSTFAEQYGNVTVNPNDGCPAIVNEMLTQIKVNYPYIRKFYALYNLLQNGRTLLDALTQAEGLKLSDGPERMPVGEAQSALYYARNFARGPTRVPLSALSFKSPFPGVTQAMWNGFYFNKIVPKPEDYQQAAQMIVPFKIQEPCADSATGGMCPSDYNLSLSDFFQKQCHDYVRANAAQKMVAPLYARWPANPEQICDHFNLAYDRTTKRFFWVYQNRPLETYGRTLKTPEQVRLFRDVVNDGIMRNLPQMISQTQTRLFSFVADYPYVALMGSSHPDLFQLKGALRSITNQAHKNWVDFEKLFMKLQKNPSDRRDYLSLLDRTPVVVNLLHYPSPDMISAAAPAVWQKVAADLISEHQGDQAEHSLIVNAAWIIGPAVGDALCIALTKFPTGCSIVTLALTTGLALPYMWDSYSTFNEIFGEVFSSADVAGGEAAVLKKSKALAAIDSSVTEDNFNFQSTVLRSLGDLDAAHSTELWQTIFTIAGTGGAVVMSWGRFAKIYAILKADPEIASQLRAEFNAGEKAEAIERMTKFKTRLKRVARFLARISLPMAATAEASDQYKNSH